MSEAVEAARHLTRVLRQEAAAARRAALPDLVALAEEKRDAMDLLASLGMPDEAAARDTVRELLAAAEENALVLGAVAGLVGAIETRLREELAAATDPGTYAPKTRLRRPVRHSLAARVDHTA